ncbi:MAG TPA: T9SS type A sorting domain-containing protein [Chitinivibrionales bacterium]|nr:T9SS type A sorting domain-containing protein [Chitinivibrionales bacterium]
MNILKVILLLYVFGLFAGCSVDRVQIISHPAAAKPGDTISVLFTDIFIVITTTSTATQSYSRDSLHIGYGLPAGWAVLSSDYYVATGIQLGQMSSLINDPSQIMTLMQDSLAIYMSRKLPMAKDNGWSAYFPGKTFSAHNIDNTDSLKLNANTVAQWIAYSSRVNLSVASGAKMDTGIALASLPIDSSTQAMIKSLYHTDSIWVKAIPVVCFAQLIAGQAEVTDTLYYYTKTGPVPGPSSPFLPNFDKGDMTYAAININKKNAVEQPLYVNQARSLLSVRPGPGASTRIMIGGQTQGRLSICDMAGKVIWRGGQAVPQNSAVVWNQTNSSGVKVNPGMYIVRLQTEGQCASQVVKVIR